YRIRHTANTQFILSINAKLISPLSYAYLGGNEFFHVYTIVYLAFRPMSDYVRELMYMVLFMETIPLGTVFCMIWLNTLIKSSTRCLVPLLARFAGNSKKMGLLREHWKSMVYYELLHRRK